MNKAQTVTLAVACIAIFAVNLPHVLPQFYKRAFTPLGPDAVSVSIAGPDSSDTTVPLPTGERIHVSLRASYRLDELNRTPRLTISLLLSFAVLYAIVTRLSTKPAATPIPK